eukprot:109383-Chlamydomonas_euryale.AAC.3
MGPRNHYAQPRKPSLPPHVSNNPSPLLPPRLSSSSRTDLRFCGISPLPGALSCGVGVVDSCYITSGRLVWASGLSFWSSRLGLWSELMVCRATDAGNRRHPCWLNCVSVGIMCTCCGRAVRGATLNSVLARMGFTAESLLASTARSLLALQLLPRRHGQSVGRHGVLANSLYLSQ